MSSFILKIIACCSMFIDHLRYAIPSGPLFMTYIGRLAFPIFAFQISEGYSHTKNLKKYLLRLFIFALVSQIPYTLYFKINSLNVLFTLFLGTLAICAYDNMKKNKFLSIILIFSCMLVSELAHTDYGFYGILIILIFYIFKNNKIIMTLLFSIITIVYLFIKFNFVVFNYKVILLIICTLCGIIPCLLYNGKQGKKVKYLIYFFYPVHILILYLITTFI